MISYFDKEYKQTKLIKQGKLNIEDKFKDFSSWINQKYNVNTINIISDKIDHNSISRIQIIFEKSKDLKKFIKKDYFSYDKIRQDEVAKQFLKMQPENKDIPLIVFRAFESYCDI